MTWQQQMSSQKQDYENNLTVVLNRIRNLEQKRMAQNPRNSMHEHGQGYPGNPSNQNLFAPQTQPDSRFSHESQNFSRNPQYSDQRFHQPGRPRYPSNNSSVGNPNQSFGQRTPQQAIRQRPPMSGQNNPNLDRPGHWQNNQFHDNSGDYTDNYNENNWNDDYQDHGGYDNSHDYYDPNQV